MFLKEDDSLEILIANDFEVIKVIPAQYSRESYQSLLKEQLDDPKNINHKVLLNFYPNNRSYPVGTKLSSSFMQSLMVVKNKNYQSLERDRSGFSKEDKAGDELRLLKYIESLTPEKILRAEEVLLEVKTGQQIPYRCFYQSNKMYWAKDQVLSMAKQLLTLVGVEVSEDLVYQEIYDALVDRRFSFVLRKSFLDVINVDFCMERNHEDLWYEDAKTLFAGVQLFSNALDLLTSMSRRILSNKFFIFKETTLDWDEAGGMEVFDPARILRYQMKDSPDLPKYQAAIKKVKVKVPAKKTLKKGKK